MNDYWDDKFNTHKTIHKLTDDAIDQMRQYQFEYCAGALLRCIPGFSDDDYDYIPCNLAFTSLLFDATIDSPRFTLEQLRLHVANVCTYDAIDMRVLAMLFDSYEHAETFDRDVNPTSWDYEDPSTWPPE